MSKEVMVLVRCDKCDRPADENLPIAQDIPVGFAKATAEVDLCGECREEAREQVMAWVNLGRKPLKSKALASVPRQPQKKQMPASITEDNPVVCGYHGCTYKAKNEFGLTIHKARVHDIRGTRRKGSKRSVPPVRKTTRKTAAKRTPRRVTAKA